MNTNIVKKYYILLATIVGIKIITTVFAGGVSIYQSEKLSELNMQQYNLMQKEQKLKNELSQKASITNLVASNDFVEYKEIQDSLSISINTTLASR